MVQRVLGVTDIANEEAAAVKMINIAHVVIGMMNAVIPEETITVADITTEEDAKVDQDPHMTTIIALVVDMMITVRGVHGVIDTDGTLVQNVARQLHHPPKTSVIGGPSSSNSWPLDSGLKS